MKHYLDVRKLKGSELPFVDVVTFGSPCQDLSVAGQRKGLKHEDNGDDETTRSGLFMDAIRIIKEMREASNGIYPTFAVWENVQGAFSSNKGEDFRIVLEEFVKIVEPTAKMPAPDKNGWAYADIVVGDGWSIAYRLVDAQYWGVPQRRKRIYLVADFRGERAGEILFKREGLRGYFAQGRTPWQGITADAEGCVGVHDSERNGLICYTPWDSQTRRVYSVDGVAPGLCSGAVTSGQNQQSFLIPVGNCSEKNCVGYDGYTGDLTSDTSSTLGVNCGMSTGRNGVIVRTLSDVASTLRAGAGAPKHESDFLGRLVVQTYDARGNGDTLLFEPRSQDGVPRIYEDVCPTLNTMQGGQRQPCVVIEERPIYCLQGNGIDRADTAGCNGKGWRENQSYTLNTIDRPAVVYAIGNGQADQLDLHDIPGALNCMHDQQAVLVALDRAFYNQGQNALYDPQFYTDGTVPTLVAKGPGAVAYEEKPRYIVRRLTPTECARLQGFPDKWGHLSRITDMSEEDVTFWNECLKVNAEIKGKTYKDKTKEQLIKWYNKLHTDSAEYKMWGNGLALPNALYLLEGIAEHGAKTMGSLFDGSGGFPLASSMCGIEPVWASEIEPYPIAVTKERFT